MKKTVSLVLFAVWVISACSAPGNSSTTSTTTTLNLIPTAEAGADCEAYFGKTVAISASAADGDGDTLSYLWTASPSGLVISNADSLTPVIVASTTATDYTVTLTVTDDQTNVSDSFIFTSKPAVYVSTYDGSSAGSGLTPQTAKDSLQDGVNLMENGYFLFYHGSETNVATTTVTAKSNCVISGGWNPAFTTGGGESTLVMTGTNESVLTMNDCMSISISNFCFTGAENDGSSFAGGGISMTSSDSNVVVCDITGNTAYVGGGLLLDYSDYNVFWGQISENAAEIGGGVYESQSLSNSYYSDVLNNVAQSDGGGFFIQEGYGTWMSGTISNNVAGGDGAGLHFSFCTNVLLSGTVLENKAIQNGGGIYLSDSENLSIFFSCVIVSNYCNAGQTNMSTLPYYGGALKYNGCSYSAAGATTSPNFRAINGTENNIAN